MDEKHFKTDIEEISLEGFQVVSSDYFSNRNIYDTPTCTIWPSGIAFNKIALTALNNCERVRMEINPARKCILVTPVTAKDKDAILWRKNIKEFAPKRMESVKFSSAIYEVWQWEKENTYRAKGRIVSADSKIMLLFDFSHPETWRGKGKREA